MHPRASARQLTAWHKLTTKKGRREAGQFILEGVRLVGEAIASTHDVQSVVLADDDRGRAAWQKLQAAIMKRAIPVHSLPPRDFDKLADTVHAAGAACVLKWKTTAFDPRSVAQEAERILVCDRIADPGNLGTLIRTAAALGLDGVVLLPETAELTNPKTVRAAAGALFHIPVYEEVPASAVVAWAKQINAPLIVADAHRGGTTMPPVSRRWALVIGGETIALDREWEHVTSHWITLPLARNVESLNAAIAGAIVMDRLCQMARRRPADRRRDRS